jgi:hypothetical protein
MARWALDAAGLLVSLLTLVLIVAWADSHHQVHRALNGREVWQHSDGSATVAILDFSSAHGGFRIDARWMSLARGTDTMIERRWEWRSMYVLQSGGYSSLFVGARDYTSVLESVGVLLNGRFGRDDLNLFVVMPYYMPVTLMLPLSVWWVVNVRRRWRIRSRRLAGQCLHCGYDLRGSTEGPCPECGAIKTAAATSPDNTKLVAPTDRTLSSPP